MKTALNINDQFCCSDNNNKPWTQWGPTWISVLLFGNSNFHNDIFLFGYLLASFYMCLFRHSSMLKYFRMSHSGTKNPQMDPQQHTKKGKGQRNQEKGNQINCHYSVSSTHHHSSPCESLHPRNIQKHLLSIIEYRIKIAPKPPNNRIYGLCQNDCDTFFSLKKW